MAEANLTWKNRQMINFKFKTSGCRPIGLDIGHSSIKMVQLAVGHGQIRVVAADKVRIDADINGDQQARREFVISSIKRLRAEGKFRGRSVVSCLPNDDVKITSLRLTEAEQNKIEQVLRDQIVERFGMDPDRDTVDYVLAGDVRQGDQIRTELILFAASSEAIRSHIELLEQAGLQLAAMDVVPCALFRSFERSLRRHEDKQRTVVFIDTGSRFTTVVFGRGGEISFVKQIPIGGERFDQEVAAKLGVDINEAQILRGSLRMERAANAQAGPASSGDGETSRKAQDNGVSLDPGTRQGMVDAISAVAEQLAREISLCFRYYTVTFRGKRVERAVVAGGEAYEDILLDVLRRQLAVEVEQAQPFRGFDMTDVNIGGCKRSLLSEWTVAVGLALKGYTNGDLITAGQAGTVSCAGTDTG